MKKILLIVNPKAGKGTINRKLPKITKNFEKQGYEIKTIYTRPNYTPTEIIRENNEKIDIIICCGGDGTLNELINAIMPLEHRPNISFIPLGTMNDFARTIRMSTSKVFLSKNINESNLIPSDIGSFNGKYFNYVAAFGAFTCVAYVTPHKLKRTFGKFAYFIIAIKYLNKIRNYRIKIQTDENEIEDNFIFGSISNSKSIGGFEWFKRKGVKIDDGKFEVLLIKTPKTAGEWLKVIYYLLVKKHDSKFFYYTQTNKIKITSKINIPWTLDGEYGGRCKEVEIENNNKPIKYIIPR